MIAVLGYEQLHVGHDFSVLDAYAIHDSDEWVDRAAEDMQKILDGKLRFDDLWEAS